MKIKRFNEDLEDRHYLNDDEKIKLTLSWRDIDKSDIETYLDKPYEMSDTDEITLALLAYIEADITDKLAVSDIEWEPIKND